MSEKISLSPNQIKAVESKEKTLLVSASAGSGKTKVLIERIFNILCTEKIDLSNMLVMTFTELASSEMKTRLKQLIINNAENNEFLKKQLEEINIANISTIHSFCKNLIKEYFYAVQIDPDFNVIDDKEADLYKIRAFNLMLEYYAKKNDEEFNNIVDILFENRDEDNFKSNIISLYDFLLSKSKDFKNQSFENIFNEDIEKNKAISYFIHQKQELCEYFINQFNDYLLSAEQINSKQLILQIINHLSKIKKIEVCNYFELYSCFETLEKFDNPRLSKPTVEESEIKEKIGKLLKNVKANIGIMKSCCYQSKEDMTQSFSINKANLSKLYEVVDVFGSFYQKIKLSKNSLDFNDLEQYTLKILENRNIKEQIQKKYKYIFIDEYQDTNDVQENILKALTSENYLFMVGDAKQSIYMFRQCNPQIFINKFYELSLKNKDSVISLNENYRSDRDILNFSNLVFDKIMTKNTSQIDYQNTSNFVFGEKFNKVESKFTPVNLCLIDTQKEKEDEEIIKKDVYSVMSDETQVNNKSNTLLEAKLIGEKIHELLNVEIFDNDQNVKRKIEYKDIAILAKNKDTVKNVASILSLLNNPIRASYKSDIFLQTETILIQNIIRLIYYFNDDRALFNVLHSPIYNLSNNDFALIKLNTKSENFYQKVIEYKEKFDDEVSKQIKKLLGDIANFQKQYIAGNVSDLLDSIVNYFDFAKMYFRKDNYEEIMQNINNFVLYIKSLNSQTLSEVITYFDDMVKEKKVDVSIKSSDNSVYIGTMHSSKGLEYPVVFYCDSSKQFNNLSIMQKLLKDNELGIILPCFDIKTKTIKDSAIKNIFKLKIKEQERQEEMRLLYVTLTRPKCYLFVVGSCNFSQIESIKTNYEIKNVNNELDYILGSLSESDIDNIKNHNDKFLTTYNDLKFNIEAYNENYKEIEEVEIINMPVDETLTKQLKQYNEIKFKKNDYVFKNTVTALSELEEDENYSITDFKRMKKDYKNSDEDFLSIGTNYHLAMQHANFKQSKIEDIDKLFESLIRQKMLSNDEIKNIDKSKVLNAINIISNLITKTNIILREKQFVFFPKLSEVISTNVPNNVLVQGTVDLMIIKENEIILIDYKTSRIRDENEFSKRYSTQLSLYQKAIEKFYKKSVTKKYIYSFYLDKLIIV